MRLYGLSASKGGRVCSCSMGGAGKRIAMPREGMYKIRTGGSAPVLTGTASTGGALKVETVTAPVQHAVPNTEALQKRLSGLSSLNLRGKAGGGTKVGKKCYANI